MTPKGQIINGYKATDENMLCNGFKFKIGKWYEHKGNIALCKSGFHFCTYPSGPREYCGGGRLFKCEAELAILSTGPGADLKHVAKRIRLTEEITPDENAADKYNSGHRNTGYRNTGNRNTGNRNTGNRNAGNGNTGDDNTGYVNAGNDNAGHGNTGNYNAGHRNNGRRNSGNRNAGDSNSGNGNIGDSNSGNGNIGDRNSGQGNCGNWQSGDFNVGDAPYYIFGKKADRNKVSHSLIIELCELLAQDDDIDPTPFLSLPNATVEKIKALHEAHKAARRKYRELLTK